jgi:DNA-binding IclR family transcriptional regulator
MGTTITKNNVRISDDPSRGKPVAESEDSKTLKRGLSLMDALLAAPSGGLRVIDLCLRTGLTRSSVHRLLNTLLEAGYAAQLSRFRYGAGPKWDALAPTERQRRDLSEHLEPLLAAISQACGDATFAVVREGAASLCIARQVGNYPVQALVIKVGTSQPLGVGAAGLALLSALTPREIDMVIEANREELNLYGNLSAEGLRSLIKATQERGWSVVGNYAVKGVLAVGKPVFDKGGKLLAGISVAATAERMPVSRQREIAHLIGDAMQEHGFL